MNVSSISESYVGFPMIVYEKNRIYRKNKINIEIIITGNSIFINIIRIYSTIQTTNFM